MSSRSASPELSPSTETVQIFVKSVSGDSKPSPFPLAPRRNSLRNDQDHSPNLSKNTIADLSSLSTAFPITVPQDLSIQNLTTLLSLRTSRPEADLRLVYGGRHLSAPRTLADYHIQRESTLHLAFPLLGGMPPKKIRCTYKDCKEGAQRIIGDCGFCNGHYCGKHRLLEDHKCDGLEDVSVPSPASSPLSSSSYEIEDRDGGAAADAGDHQWWLVGLDGILADVLSSE
jgi:hypothetical protein